MVSKSLSIPRLGFISSIAFLGIFVPAKRPSFWIKSADFTRHYQKIGGTWLPLRDQTVSQVRLFGENVLTIDHADYKVSVRLEPIAQADHASLPSRIEVWGLKNLRNL